jgi:sec-independent protein translocase protein TatC
MADSAVQPAPQLEANLDERSEQLKSMSFLEHLEELRKRIILSLVGLGAGFGVAFGFHNQIYTFMERPIMEVLRRAHMEEKLVYTSPTEPFNMSLKIALVGGLFIACPWILYQLWCFISPGLYRTETKYVMPFMVSTILLFVAGGFFGYKLVYPAALQFFIDWGAHGGLRPMITITEYTNLFLTITVGLGVLFEMPVVVFFLALMGLVSAGWMWRNFRYGIGLIFIIALIIAPTPDIMSTCLFASPMLVLYFISIGVAWMAHPKQRAARAARAKS